jgi:hypothetical protein
VKLAHLVPTQLLPYTDFASAYLCLVNLAAEDPYYESFHRRQVQAGKLVILDNPVHEDWPIDVNAWLEELERIKPTVAIIPDVIDDPAQTVINGGELRKEARKASPDSHLMAVPHGKEHGDFLECARALGAMRNPMIEWFGVSLERRLNDDPFALERRVRRVRIIQSEPALHKRNVHLLGISEQATELKMVSFRNVTSADTSKFAVFSLLGRSVAPPAPIEHTYPGRKMFGGSMEYFNYDASFAEGSLSAFREDLMAWSLYAEGRQ